MQGVNQPAFASVHVVTRQTIQFLSSQVLSILRILYTDKGNINQVLSFKCCGSCLDNWLLTWRTVKGHTVFTLTSLRANRVQAEEPEDVDCQKRNPSSKLFPSLAKLEVFDGCLRTSNTRWCFWHLWAIQAATLDFPARISPLDLCRICCYLGFWVERHTNEINNAGQWHSIRVAHFLSCFKSLEQFLVLFELMWIHLPACQVLFLDACDVCGDRLYEGRVLFWKDTPATPCRGFSFFLFLFWGNSGLVSIKATVYLQYYSNYTQYLFFSRSACLYNSRLL